MQRKAQSNSSSSHAEYGKSKAVSKKKGYSKTIKTPFKHFPELRAWIENPGEREKLPVALEYFLKIKAKCSAEVANEYWAQVKSQLALKEDEQKVDYFLQMLKGDANTVREAINEVWEKYPQIRERIMSFPKDKLYDFINKMLRSRVKDLMKNVMKSERVTAYLGSLQGDLSKSIVLFESAIIGQSLEIVKKVWEELLKDQLSQLKKRPFLKLKHLLSNINNKLFSSALREEYLTELNKSCPEFSDLKVDQRKVGKKRKKREKDEEEPESSAEEMEMKRDAELESTHSVSSHSKTQKTSSNVTPSRKPSLVDSRFALFASQKSEYKGHATIDVEIFPIAKQYFGRSTIFRFSAVSMESQLEMEFKEPLQKKCDLPKKITTLGMGNEQISAITDQVKVIKNREKEHVYLIDFSNHTASNAEQFAILQVQWLYMCELLATNKTSNMILITGLFMKFLASPEYRQAVSEVKEEIMNQENKEEVSGVIEEAVVVAPVGETPLAALTMFNTECREAESMSPLREEELVEGDNASATQLTNLYDENELAIQPR